MKKTEEKTIYKITSLSECNHFFDTAKEYVNENSQQKYRKVFAFTYLT